MKYFILLPLLLLLFGCADPANMPQEAIKSCIEKGWVPLYKDTGTVYFTCEPLEE